MEFYTTKHINKLIKKDYINFISKYYNDIFSNPNKYIELTEKKISEYLGGGYVKLLNSGTTALQLGLLVLGVEKGDEVILPANTYSATAIAITNIGANPVFVDINLENFTINTDDLIKKITPKTKAIIPVHLYGYPCDMIKINKIAKDLNIKVLEDASHAFGGEYNGSKLGTIGDIGAFSCHLSKNFGSFGNAGIFFTKNKSLYDVLNNYIFPDMQSKKILNSGRTPANIGVFDAIVLLLKLKYLDKVIENNIELYKKMKENYKKEGFVFPKLDLKNDKLHIRNFVVLTKNRDKYINSGLGKQYYSYNLAENEIFGKKVNLINTKKFFENNLALNFYFDFP